MIKKLSLNDDHFREIMVRDNVAENGNRDDQHKDRQIQDGNQALSCQLLNHSGNDLAVTNISFFFYIKKFTLH